MINLCWPANTRSMQNALPYNSRAESLAANQLNQMLGCALTVRAHMAPTEHSRKTLMTGKAAASTNVPIGIDV
jgi:hypothetical protein